jgi:DNA primase
MHDDRELEEALELLDMQFWLDRQGIQYRETRGSRGRQLNVKECPCCGGSGYKVYLNAETGLGNCFSGSCEMKFSKWKFIRASLGAVTIKQVIDHIKAVAREQGWRPPRLHAMATNLNVESLRLPLSVALPHEGRNVKYLENRGISAAIAQYFGLRLSVNGAFFYTDDEGRKRAQDYSKRIIIPVFDLAGDLVSFQGRDITGTADRKYLFPPGFASTGSHLYNGQNATRAKHAVIGEGAFDVMATKIALDGDMNLRDVVEIGTFGKHLSDGGDDSQMAKLMQLREGGLEVVTFMWDGEPQAIDAAIEAALLCKKYGLPARVAILPPGKDPNEIPADEVRRRFYCAELISIASATRMKLMKNFG